MSKELSVFIHAFIYEECCLLYITVSYHERHQQILKALNT